MKKHDAKKTKAIVGLVQQTFYRDERMELYSTLIETALYHWQQQLEYQTIQTVSFCFHLANQTNFKEEDIMTMQLIEKSNHERYAASHRMSSVCSLKAKAEMNSSLIDID